MRIRFFLPLGAAILVLSSPAWAVTLEPGWPQTTGYSVSQSAAAGQFDTDPQWEIAIASQDGKAYLYNHDGSLLPGWPRTMGGALGPDQYANQCSSPAVRDVDGDGHNEMIVGNFDGKMYVFRADGTLLPGWPFAAGWMIFSSPAVGQIDNDPQLEIVFGANDGKIYAVEPNGALSAGFPISTPYVVRSSPALGDLDGDGLDEIVITADNSNFQLYALDGNGTALPGFPKVICPVGSNSSPSLGDVDGDGALDIVCGARDGTLHALHADGTYLPGFPLDAGYSLQSSPTLVDLDHDGTLEIIVGLNDSKVSVYRSDGTLFPGWPQPTTYTVVSSASVGDIDNDGEYEIVIGENTGKVYAWNADGTPVPGFPLLDATYTIFSSPLLEDLDLDGRLELLIGCNDTRIYCWDLGPSTYHADRLPWPKWRLHPDNDATVPVIDPAGLAEGPDAFGFDRVLPQPARSTARIELRVPSSGSAFLQVFDSRGREVRRFETGGGNPGIRRLDWNLEAQDGRRVPSGVYFLRLRAEGCEAVSPVVVVR